jgi:hypothetical protein
MDQTGTGVTGMSFEVWGWLSVSQALRSEKGNEGRSPDLLSGAVRLYSSFVLTSVASLAPKIRSSVTFVQRCFDDQSFARRINPTLVHVRRLCYDARVQWRGRSLSLSSGELVSGVR